MFKNVFSILTSCALFAGCNILTPEIPHRTKSAIKIDGKSKEIAWSEAKLISSFQCPWSEDQIPLTTLRIFSDSSYLYFFFDVEDPQIICYNDKNINKAVEDSDRVEIFFASDSELNTYYGLEMDACGRIMDYKASFYRDIDYGWSWPFDSKKEIKVKKDKQGYDVEGKLSISTLSQLGLIKDSKLNLGIFRGEYAAGYDGQKLYWITWKIPESDKPDFHIPSAFSNLKIQI